MAKEVIDGKRVDSKLKSRNPIIEFDKLKLYFREPYVIDIEGIDNQNLSLILVNIILMDNQ